MSKAQSESFVGVSPRDGAAGGGKAVLEEALDHAAEQASKAGYAGTMFDVAIELEPNDHNQYVRSYRVTITPRP